MQDDVLLLLLSVIHLFSFNCSHLPLQFSATMTPPPPCASHGTHTHTSAHPRPGAVRE